MQTGVSWNSPCSTGYLQILPSASPSQSLSYRYATLRLDTSLLFQNCPVIRPGMHTYETIGLRGRIPMTMMTENLDDRSGFMASNSLLRILWGPNTCKIGSCLIEFLQGASTLTQESRLLTETSLQLPIRSRMP